MGVIVNTSGPVYAIGVNDEYINVNSSNSIVDVYLPNIRDNYENLQLKTFFISDARGTASTNAIRIHGSNNTVNNEVFITLSTNYGVMAVKMSSLSNYAANLSSSSATSSSGDNGLANSLMLMGG